VRDERHAGREQLRSRGLDLHGLAVFAIERDAMVETRLLAILDPARATAVLKSTSHIVGPAVYATSLATMQERPLGTRRDRSPSS
jgi:hypothetical protein